jgi:endogenous inhibitor of DNA gyrase (YacG/DUF329 family)
MFRTECTICGKEAIGKRARLYCSKKCSSKAYWLKNADKPKYATYTEFRSDKKSVKFVNDKVFDWQEYPEGVL